MNNIVLISGSPKLKHGASYEYLNILRKYLDLKCEIISSLKYSDLEIEKIKNTDTIVFSYPLYVDALPAHFLKFLKVLEDNEIKDKNIYAICNLGYYESIQGEVSLDIIKNFCLNTNNNYMGGISIGSGPVGYLNYPFINNNIKRDLMTFFDKIDEKKTINNLFTKSLLPRFLYLKIGNHSWNKQIRKNLLK